MLTINMQQSARGASGSSRTVQIPPLLVTPGRLFSCVVKTVIFDQTRLPRIGLTVIEEVCETQIIGQSTNPTIVLFR